MRKRNNGRRFMKLELAKTKQRKSDYSIHPISGVNVQPDIFIRRLIRLVMEEEEQNEY